jgi:hypothetical protein
LLHWSSKNRPPCGSRFTALLWPLELLELHEMHAASGGLLMVAGCKSCSELTDREAGGGLRRSRTGATTRSSSAWWRAPASLSCKRAWQPRFRWWLGRQVRSAHLFLFIFDIGSWITIATSPHHLVINQLVGHKCVIKSTVTSKHQLYPSTREA